MFRFNRVSTAALIALSLLLIHPGLAKTNEAVERCERAANLLDEIMGTAEKQLPLEMLHKSKCIALIPGVKKVGFGFGGRFGKGILSCRTDTDSGWSGPSTVRLEGGSFGLQIGASSTDVILLVMNEAGIEKLLSSKFTLGADAAVSAGPVGRSAQAQTDAQMSAKILSYSRSRGLFAGISVEGATLRPDKRANEQIYGQDVAAEQILAGEIPAPESATQLLNTLSTYALQAEEAALKKPKPETIRPPEPAAGIVEITSNPSYAEVEINNSFNGLTPRKKAVKPGEYQVTVRKQGFEVWSRSVTVEAGETTTLAADLTSVEPIQAEAQEGPARTIAPDQSANSGIRVYDVR